MPALIQSFRNRILSDVSGCPAPRVDQAVVDACRRLCEDTLIIEKTIEATGNPPDVAFPYTLPFVFGELVSEGFYTITIDLDDYTILDDLDPIMPIFFLIDSQGWTLQKFDLDNDIKSIEYVIQSNKKFFRFIGRTIQIFPFQAEEGEVDVLLTLATKPSIGVTSVPDVLFDQASTAVEAMSLYLLQKIPKRPWTDLDAAGLNLSIYNDEKGKVNRFRKSGGALNTSTVSGGYF